MSFFVIAISVVTAIVQADEQQQLAEVGSALSMSFSKAGAVENDLRNIAASAKKVSALKVDRAELKAARLKFFAVATMYDQGFQRRFHEITVNDIKDTYSGFMAGLSGDEWEQGKVILKALARAHEMAEQDQAKGREADAYIGLAVKQHVQVWKENMLPVVKSLAGPEADFQPFRVCIEKSPGKGKTGLKLRNVTGKKLTNVTVALDSTVGSATEGKVTHFIFLPVWSATQEIGFPWRLTAAVTDSDSNPLQGKTITYELWSAEYSLPKQTYKLPGNLKVTAKPAYRLNLEQEGGPTGRPPAP